MAVALLGHVIVSKFGKASLLVLCFKNSADADLIFAFSWFHFTAYKFIQTNIFEKKRYIIKNYTCTFNALVYNTRTVGLKMHLEMF